jgi:peptidoglycan/LPS O-acetylase OafA/YrhL
MRRTAALLVLLVLGVVSLPLVASVLDGQGTENWILPVQLLLMALLGALAGLLVPSLAGAGAGPRRGVLVGGAIGLGCAVLGVVIFFLLLNGISGA